jgi:hypothetical protein
VPSESEFLLAEDRAREPKCGELPEEVVQMDSSLSLLPRHQAVWKIDVEEVEAILLRYRWES